MKKYIRDGAGYPEAGRSKIITELAKVKNHDERSHSWTVHTSRRLTSKISWKKFMKTFSWCLDAVKRKTEQKLIIFPCPHSPPYLFRRNIGTQSHSAKFLNWGDHVNSVPDLAASPPWELPRLPTAAWASEFFRGTGGGRVFRPRMAMSKTISLLGFRSLSL